jgi:hypothetical protein
MKYSIRIIGPDYYTQNTKHWLKGNVHAHASRSDGDSTVKEVISWYVKNNYDFLAISDHNKVFNPVKHFPDGSLKKIINKYSPGKNFVLISGQEITNFCRYKGLHLNILGPSKSFYKKIKKIARKRKYRKNRKYLLRKLQSIFQKEKAILIVNHFQWRKTFNKRSIPVIPSNVLIEMYNSDPTNYTEGRKGGLSDENYWDILLSRGRLNYGVACDDSHYHQPGKHHKKASLPGGGYIYSAVEKITLGNILKSIKTGNFYGSTGIKIRKLQYENNVLSIEHIPMHEKITTQLIGKFGKILLSTQNNPATFKLAAAKVVSKIRKNSYFRIRLISKSHQYRGWLQPFKLKKKLIKNKP